MFFIKYFYFGLCLFVVILCSGCEKNTDAEMRSYFFNGHSIDLTFAKKLSQCQKYETPVKYNSNWTNNIFLVTPTSKEKVKIVGMDNDDRCIIRSYKTYPLSPFWHKEYEYHLPEYVLPYFSDIYEIAFSEQYQNETKAIQKLHAFCNKYKDFCKSTDTKDDYPELINYIRELEMFSSIKDEYLHYSCPFNQFGTFCGKVIKQDVELVDLYKE